ncbi:MAG: AtpZ/AtpI family protein [Terriglobales bacterium]
MSPDKETPRRKSLWVQMGMYSELAFIFPAATVAGWLLGLALDHWLHTSWLFLVGLIVGIVAGFVELIRIVNSADSK